MTCAPPKTCQNPKSFCFPSNQPPNTWRIGFFLLSKKKHVLLEHFSAAPLGLEAAYLSFSSSMREGSTCVFFPYILPNCFFVFVCKIEKIETKTEEGITKENFGATKVNPASYILIPDGGYLKTLISPDTSTKESHHQNTQTPSKGGIAVKFTFLCYFAKERFWCFRAHVPKCPSTSEHCVNTRH